MNKNDSQIQIQGLDSFIANYLGRGVAQDEIMTAIAEQTKLSQEVMAKIAPEIEKSIIRIRQKQASTAENFLKRRKQNEKYMLHLGCGSAVFDKWVNVDGDSATADILHDLRKPLPIGDREVDFIFNEHFLEHLTAEEGLYVMKECFRLLKPGGVLRITVPGLREILSYYFCDDWKSHVQKDVLEEMRIETRAQLINHAFRSWGHKYLYDEEELRLRLSQAGFNNLRTEEYHKSSYPELRNLETRPPKYSNLTVEAIK